MSKKQEKFMYTVVVIPPTWLWDKIPDAEMPGDTTTIRHVWAGHKEQAEYIACYEQYLEDVEEFDKALQFEGYSTAATFSNHIPEATQ